VSTPLRERPDAPLGTLIFRAGLLPAETIENALEEGVKTGKRLGEILTERGLIKEVDLARLLAGQKGLEFVTLREQIVDHEAAALFSEEQARLFRALPYAFDEGVPVVAIADPTDEVLLRNIREALGREDVKFVVSTRGELTDITTDVYSKPLAAPASSEPATEPDVAPEPAPEATAEPEPDVFDRGEHTNGTAPEDAGPIVPEPAYEPAPEQAPEPVLATPEPATPTFQVPAPEEPAIPDPAPTPEPAADYEPAPAPEPALPHEPPAAPEPPAPESPVSEPLEAHEPLAPAEPLASVEPLAPPEPLTAPEPAPAPEPTSFAEPTASPEPVPFPEPAAPPAPLPYPPAASQQEPDPEPAPAVDIPTSPTPDEHGGETAGVWRMTIKLTNGERVEAGDFPDLGAAKQQAKAIMTQIADAAQDEWPFVNGRFVKPDTIVSVDIAEHAGDESPGY